MNARRFVLGLFASAAVFSEASGKADDAPNEPILGQAVPIGRLLLVSGGLDNETEPAPPAPIPQVETGLIPLPLGDLPERLATTFPTNETSVVRVARPHPSEIQRHLSQAAVQLAAVGLTDEAQQVGLLLNQFQARHYARLLLAQKQSQLETLQAEISELRAVVAPDGNTARVMISMKFIEGPPEVLNRLAPRLATATSDDQPVRIADDQALWKEIQESKVASRLTILSAPSVTTLSGHSAQVITGGDRSVNQSLLVRSTDEQAEFHGTKVFATATVLSADRIRLSLAAEYHSRAANKNASLNGFEQRLESLTEVHDGETLAYHIIGQTPPVLLLVKTSIVKPVATSGESTRSNRSVTPVGRTVEPHVR